MLIPIKSDEFDNWIKELKDFKALNKINAKISRICNLGSFYGDIKKVGSGVTEIRIQGKGPGYRIYAAIRALNKEVLLLLLGGDKSSQENDINKASALLAEWDKSAIQNIESLDGLQGEEDGKVE